MCACGEEVIGPEIEHRPQLDAPETVGQERPTNKGVMVGALREDSCEQKYPDKMREHKTSGHRSSLKPIFFFLSIQF